MLRLPICLLALSVSAAAPAFAQRNNCSDAQNARFQQLSKNYFSTAEAQRKTNGYQALAGDDGVVHGKAYCAAIERHIRAADAIASYVENAGCFQPTTGPVWRARVGEAMQDRAGCVRTPKRELTAQDHERARIGFAIYRQCIAEKRAQRAEAVAASMECQNRMFQQSQ